VEIREFQITREAWTSSRRTDSFAYVATQHRPPPRSAEASMAVGKSADPIIVHMPAPEAAAVAELHPESNPVRSSDTSPPPMAWAS
jgi:hypothetical protein